MAVNIHNSIIKNNKELKSIKVDIDRNKQSNYFLKYIKDKNYLENVYFLLQEKLYISEFSRILKGMQSSTTQIVSKQIIREYFFNKLNWHKQLLSEF